MIRLFSMLIGCGLIWSIYWAIGSAGMSAAISDWIEDRRAEGWVAETLDIETTGFPAKFDTVIRNLSLADPETGLAWDAPSFELRAQSVRPWHIDAIWPADQRFATPLARYEVASQDMQAVMETRLQDNLALERVSFAVSDLSIQKEMSVQPLRAAMVELDAMRLPKTQTEAEARYQIRLTADGFAPALDWRTRIDPGGSLPETLDALTADMTFAFDAPWDLDAIEVARPQPRALDVRLAEARWGRLELQMAGSLDIDTGGQPTGEITIKARNWREILRLSVESGALPARLSQTIEDGLSLVAQLAGNPQTLDIPLTFRNGRVFLGPVPIGPAPIMRLR
ncbi:MAG: DUF2125 domain-containing protein [Pseudomonadota bacterium]